MGIPIHVCAAISWGSKKHPVVALSSCQAEIMAASEAAKEVLHLRGLLSDLDQGDPNPMHLSVDDQSAIAVAYNPEQHMWTLETRRSPALLRSRMRREHANGCSFCCISREFG